MTIIIINMIKSSYGVNDYINKILEKFLVKQDRVATVITPGKTKELKTIYI